MAHPDLVGVGEGEAERDVRGRKVLADDVPLQGEVAPGALHAEEKGLESGAEGVETHERPFQKPRSLVRRGDATAGEPGRSTDSGAEAVGPESRLPRPAPDPQ